METFISLIYQKNRDRLEKCFETIVIIGYYYEWTIDIRCKDEDGTVHHIQTEYNVYK